MSLAEKLSLRPYVGASTLYLIAPSERFILYHDKLYHDKLYPDKRHPRDMSAPEMAAFLIHTHALNGTAVW